MLEIACITAGEIFGEVDALAMRPRQMACKAISGKNRVLAIGKDNLQNRIKESEAIQQFKDAAKAKDEYYVARIKKIIKVVEKRTSFANLHEKLSVLPQP